MPASVEGNTQRANPDIQLVRGMRSLLDAWPNSDETTPHETARCFLKKKPCNESKLELTQSMRFRFGFWLVSWGYGGAVGA